MGWTMIKRGLLVGVILMFPLALGALGIYAATVEATRFALILPAQPDSSGRGPSAVRL